MTINWKAVGIIVLFWTGTAVWLGIAFLLPPHALAVVTIILLVAGFSFAFYVVLTAPARRMP